MADGTIGGILNGLTDVAKSTRPTGGVGRGRTSASGAANAAAPSTRSAGTAGSIRQVINFEGQSFNPRARRGTYLNVLI